MADPSDGIDFPHRAVDAASGRLGLPDNVASRALYHDLIGLALVISDAETLGARDTVDWGSVLGRPDLPRKVWKVQVPFSFGCPLCYFPEEPVSRWFPARLTLGALCFLLMFPYAKGGKQARGLVLSLFRGLRRIKRWSDDPRPEGVLQVFGVSFDDDGVIGRLKLNPKYLSILFGTASDGKHEDLVSCEAYQTAAKKHGWPAVPTAESMSAYLNIECHFGHAYRNVVVSPHSAMPGRPEIVQTGDGLHYRASFEPQERTRILIIFARPLEGELLCSLLAAKDGYSKFCELLELEVLGLRGTDVKCFDPTRIGYMPSGASDKYFFAVMGPGSFVDPVPIAEKVVAELPAQPQRTYTIGSMDAVPQGLKSTLRGVRLASLIADIYPDLVHSENNLAPLTLKRCPFADEHRSKRGQADNTLYCYDPEVSPYPVMRCRHATCGERDERDFVDAMISQGELDRSTVFDNPDYRDAYEDASRSALPPALVPGWRRHLNNK